MGANPIPIEIPIGQEDLYKGVVDLISNRALVWDESSNGQRFEEIPMPTDLKETAAEYRQKLIEGVAEENEELLEKFFDDPDSIRRRDHCRDTQSHAVEENCAGDVRFCLQEQRCADPA